ncbi:MAG: glycerol-3-phosphate acyltransferase [Clostridia bacterium]
MTKNQNVMWDWYVARAGPGGERVVKAVAIAVLSYVIGSIPFSYLAAMVFKKIDLRKVGSRNVGTTNVLKSAGLIPGLLAAVGDCGKGVVAVLIARATAPELSWVTFAAGLLAVVGHNWPIWLGFHGGGGLATCIGSLLVLSAASVFYLLALWGASYVLTRHKYASSLFGCMSLPVFLGIYEQSWAYFGFGFGMGVLLGAKQVMAWLRYGKKPESIAAC